LNRSQLRAMLWMRSRVLVNRLSRSGKLNKMLLGLLLFGSVVLSLGLFLLALLLGLEELEGAEAQHILWIWIGLSLPFLFFWMIGLMTELQRSDTLSFKNLLHLPVSLGWVFLYNYLSSFVSLSILLFLPPMLGLGVAMVVVFGLRMLLVFLLVAAFFLMVTALTYQLRGWLAHLMEDKRRGRSIVVGITFAFILLAQLPNLINISNSQDRRERNRQKTELQITIVKEGPGMEAAQRELDAFLEEEKASELKIEQLVATATMVVPFGWLAYGTSATFNGQLLLGLLCAAGMLAISGLSLRRAYRKTMLSVVSGGGSAAPARKSKAKEQGRRAARQAKTAKRPLVEREFPLIGEGASAIATSAVQSLLRAPEAKMMLLSPVILIGMFGMMLFNNPNRASLGGYLPGMSLSAVGLALLSLQQLFQNQFGLDRDGFRAYLLSPIARDRILLGKNMALAPIGIAIGMVGLLVLQLMVPMGIQHFLGAVLQLVSAYLVLSLIGNLLSILAPMRLKGVGMKASGAKMRVFLLQMMSFFLVPLTLSPLLLPWGAEFLLRGEAWATAVPVYLLLQAVMLAVVLQVYRWGISSQGALLQERECQILETLTRES